MSDIEQPQLPEVDFDQLANLFIELDVFASPSELHGLLCGLLAQGGAINEQDWLASAATYLEQQQIESDEAKATLLDLYTLAQQQIQGAGFDLELLIPDDDTELALRVESVGLWCQGFLSGFGGSKLNLLSEETRETVMDFTQIARIEQDELDESEDNEQDLMQIIEYVRMGAILVYSEVVGSAVAADNQSPPSLH